LTGKWAAYCVLLQKTSCPLELRWQDSFLSREYRMISKSENQSAANLTLNCSLKHYQNLSPADSLFSVIKSIFGVMLVTCCRKCFKMFFSCRGMMGRASRLPGGNHELNSGFAIPSLGKLACLCKTLIPGLFPYPLSVWANLVTSQVSFPVVPSPHFSILCEIMLGEGL
jgi:hypothetical protein